MSILITLIQKALAAFIAAMLAAMPAEVPKEQEVVKDVPEVVQEVIEPVRYDDHIYVGSIDVRVVKVEPTNTYELQHIVDDPATAVCYQYSKCLYIGDHNNQAFATLPAVQNGDTMTWQGRTYKCYYADDNGYLDSIGHIHLSTGEYLYEQETLALVTCKTDYTRYIRLFKEV